VSHAHLPHTLRLCGKMKKLATRTYKYKGGSRVRFELGLSHSVGQFCTVPLALTTHQDHQRGNAVSNGDTTPPPSFRVCRLALILPYLCTRLPFNRLHFDCISVDMPL
jgi:hypothetical protein